MYNICYHVYSIKIHKTKKSMLFIYVYQRNTQISCIAIYIYHIISSSPYTSIILSKHSSISSTFQTQLITYRTRNPILSNNDFYDNSKHTHDVKIRRTINSTVLLIRIAKTSKTLYITIYIIDSKHNH